LKKKNISPSHICLSILWHKSLVSIRPFLSVVALLFHALVGSQVLASKTLNSMNEDNDDDDDDDDDFSRTMSPSSGSQRPPNLGPPQQQRRVCCAGVPLQDVAFVVVVVLLRLGCTLLSAVPLTLVE
jgi:hypothetical protein